MGCPRLDKLNQTQGRRLGIGRALAGMLVVLLPLGFWGGMPIAAWARGSDPAGRNPIKTARSLADLPAYSGAATDLTGTVAQPYQETLLPVPLPPAASTQSELGVGGPAEPSPFPAVPATWLIEIHQPASDSFLPPYVVVRPVQQPAAEQTNVINVIVP